MLRSICAAVGCPWVVYGNQECFRALQYVCCRARVEPRIHRRHRFLVGTENILNSATFAACARRSTIDRAAYAIPTAYCTLSLRSVCLAGSLSPSLPLSMHIGRLHAQLAFCFGAVVSLYMRYAR